MYSCHKINIDWYPTAIVSKHYIFSMTTGDAQKRLREAKEAGSPVFLDFEDMVAFLSTLYANPNEQQEAYLAYHRLVMTNVQTY